MVIKRIFLVLLIFVSISNADIFEKGKLGVGISLGTSYSYNNTYTLVGISANYFAIDNLSVGLAYRGWLGATPTKNELSFSANYYIPTNSMFRPYIGAFIRDAFVSGYDDYISYGARGGISLIRENTYISLGYAYERYSKEIFGNEISTSYPELVFGLSF